MDLSTLLPTWAMGIIHMSVPYVMVLPLTAKKQWIHTFKPAINPSYAQAAERQETFFDQVTCSKLHSLEIEWMEQDMEALTVQPVSHCKPSLSKKHEIETEKGFFQCKHFEKTL